MRRVTARGRWRPLRGNEKVVGCPTVQITPPVRTARVIRGVARATLGSPFPSTSASAASCGTARPKKRLARATSGTLGGVRPSRWARARRARARSAHGPLGALRCGSRRSGPAGNKDHAEHDHQTREAPAAHHAAGGRMSMTSPERNTDLVEHALAGERRRVRVRLRLRIGVHEFNVHMGARLTISRQRFCSSGGSDETLPPTKSRGAVRAAAASAAPICSPSGGAHSSPWSRSTQLRSNPFLSNLFHSIPFHSIALHCFALHSISFISSVFLLSLRYLDPPQHPAGCLHARPCSATGKLLPGESWCKEAPGCTGAEIQTCKQDRPTICRHAPPQSCARGAPRC